MDKTRSDSTSENCKRCEYGLKSRAMGNAAAFHPGFNESRLSIYLIPLFRGKNTFFTAEILPTNLYDVILEGKRWDDR